MTTHWADVDPDDIAWLYGGHCEPAWDEPRRRDIHHLPDISEWNDMTTTPAESTTLARVVRTCVGAPDQWNAWTVSGQYLYLRWRGGRGTVDAYDSPDWETWPNPPEGRVASFEDTSEPGPMDLDEFLDLAGLELAPDAVVEGEDDDYDGEQVQCWHIEPGSPCDWNICRQPERLKRGDTGTDPALGLHTPNLDRIRNRQEQQ